MQSLTTPFTYPKATLYSLFSPLIELREALIATREGRGTIRIEPHHFLALFRRFTCDSLEGGVGWSKRKITLLTLSAASLGISFIGSSTAVMPVVLYVGYRMYKVCLIRELLDKNIDPYDLLDYLSSPSPLLSERVPAIANLYTDLTGTYHSMWRALYLPSGSTRLTMPLVDHDQIITLTPDLMRMCPDEFYKEQVFDWLGKFNVAQRPQFHERMMDCDQQVADPVLKRALVRMVLSNDRALGFIGHVPINENERIECLGKLTSVITKLSNDESRRELINNLSRAGNERIRLAWIRSLSTLFDRAADDPPLNEQITQAIVIITQPLLLHEGLAIESVPLLYELITDVLPRFEQAKEGAIQQLLFMGFMQTAREHQQDYVMAMQHLLNKSPDASIQYQVVRLCIFEDNHLEYIDLMTDGLSRIAKLSIATQLRLMERADFIKYIKSILPLFEQLESEDAKQSLSQIFVNAPRGMWSDLHVMIGSLFNEKEDTAGKQEITQFLAALLSNGFYRDGSIPYLGSREEHSLLHQLITKLQLGVMDEQQKRQMFKRFSNLSSERRREYVESI